MLGNSPISGDALLGGSASDVVVECRHAGRSILVEILLTQDAQASVGELGRRHVRKYGDCKLPRICEHLAPSLRSEIGDGLITEEISGSGFHGSTCSLGLLLFSTDGGERRIGEIILDRRNFFPDCFEGPLCFGPQPDHYLWVLLQLFFNSIDSGLFFLRPTSKFAQVQLGTVIARGVERFVYTYDYGDNWRHDVIVEEVRDGDPDMEYPAFVDGARRCPPEDVGGPDGFMDFLEAVLDSAHEQHRDMVRWYGGPFDPIGLDEKRARFGMENMARRWRGPLASHRTGSRRPKR